MSFGDESLAAFLHGRWDEVLVEQLGAGRAALVESDEEAVLLRLTLPEELLAQISKADRRMLPAKPPLLFEVRIVPQLPPP